MNDIRIREMAGLKGLNEKETEILVKLMETRFPMEGSPSYVCEWADRIKKGSAFAHGDTQTRKVLISLGVTK